VIIQIIGPPGTGKTTTISNVINKIDDPTDVVALTFTRAAKAALADKSPRLDPSRNITTLHSKIWRYLDLGKENLLGPWHTKRFFETHGIPYSIRQDDSGLDVVGSRGNMLESLFAKILHVSPVYGDNVRRAIGGVYTPGGEDGFLSRDHILRLFKSWEKWQMNTGLLSYDYMLSLGKNMMLSGSHLVLDEAQDLTPLMIQILRKNFKNFRYVYVIGDDDQSIFQFSGADPTFLVDMMPDKRIVLGHSWRLPVPIWDLSQRYIKRNKNRTEKEFSPSDHQGKVVIAPDYMSAIEQAEREKGEILVILRHRYQVQELADQLRSDRKFFKMLGSTVKQPTLKIRRLLNFAWCVRHDFNRRLDAPTLRTVIEEISSKTLKGLRISTSKKELSKQVMRSLSELVAVSKDWSRIINAFFSGGYSLFGALGTEANSWNRLWTSYDCEIAPRISIGTIHTAKGLQSDNVILGLDVSSKVFNRLHDDDERRVFYVGMTRANHNLFLVGSDNAEILELNHALR